MKKLLILGISGLTGSKLAKISTSKYEVFGTYNLRSTNIENVHLHQVDVTNFDAISKLFSEVKPDIVINTTALHNVDYCEENKEHTNLVNSKAIDTLKKNAKNFGSKLIHLSTDYVFDGEKNKPYTEQDDALPLSFYGLSKLQGEKIVLENSQCNVVIRPSVVYGWTPLELTGKTSSSGKPLNFALWVLTKLHNQEPLKIVTDQFSTATLADSLAENILKIAETDNGGLYHVSGLSCESRYDFSIKLAEEMGYDSSLISPVNSSEFNQKAKRPTNSCLDCNKAIKKFDLNLLTTEEALKIMRNQIESEHPELLGNN